jgi:hypothetical protein
MVILGKIALGVFGTMVAGVGLICSEGFVTVNVVEHQPEQHHIFVMAPAAIMPITARFIPADKFDKAARQLKPYMPTIRAAMDALEKTDDVTLVEVKNAEEHVLVRKVGGSVIVDVDDHDDHVHVSTPIGAVESTIEQIASSQSSAAWTTRSDGSNDDEDRDTQ